MNSRYLALTALLSIGACGDTNREIYEGADLTSDSSETLSVDGRDAGVGVSYRSVGEIPGARFWCEFTHQTDPHGIFKGVVAISSNANEADELSVWHWIPGNDSFSDVQLDPRSRPIEVNLESDIRILAYSEGRPIQQGAPKEAFPGIEVDYSKSQLDGRVYRWEIKNNLQIPQLIYKLENCEEI